MDICVLNNMLKMSTITRIITTYKNDAFLKVIAVIICLIVPHVEI